MAPNTSTVRLPLALSKITAVTAIAALLGAGCSVAPSRTARGAGVGAGAGAIAGSVVGPSLGVDPAVAMLGAAAAGGIIGGVIGAIQDARENREQQDLAMQRAYVLENSKRRAQQAREQGIMEEELEISQGYRISDLELIEARRKAEESESQLKALVDERAAARARKKELDDLEQKHLENVAKIAQLAEELARLKGENPQSGPLPTSAQVTMPDSQVPTAPAVPAAGTSPSGATQTAPNRPGL